MTDASIDSIIALDLKLGVSAWNQKMASLSQRSYADVAGSRLMDVFPEARRITGLEFALSRALSGMKSFIPSSERFFLPGSYETHIVPIRGEGATIIGVLLILHDVSHRTKAEEALKALNRALTHRNSELQDAHDELAVFARIAAQHLRAPMQKMYGFADRLMADQGDAMSAAERADFRQFQEGARRLSLMTEDLIRFSELCRIRQPERVNLSEVLADVCAELAAPIRESAAQINSASLPLLTGNRAALFQMLYQLIDNAIKFRDPLRAPEIDVQCEAREGYTIPDSRVDPEQEYYHIVVSDNGIGFEPEARARIFGLFERLHAEHRYRGTGMGLAIALKAARLHSGFILADATPQEGSVFHCYLPVTD